MPLFRSWPATLFSAWVVVTPILSGCVTVPQDSSASQSKPVATGQTQSAAPALATSAPALPAVEYTIYQGHYTCAQGRTALTLKINMTGNVADAVFDFKTQRDIRGAFAMQGTFDGKTGKIRLQGRNWINQPRNFSTVNLLGTFNADRSRLSGQVIGNGCSTFEVRKTGAETVTMAENQPAPATPTAVPTSQASGFFKEMEIYPGNFRCNGELASIIVMPYHLTQNHIALWVNLFTQKEEIEYIAYGTYNPKTAQYRFRPEKLLGSKELLAWWDSFKDLPEDIRNQRLQNPPGKPLPGKSAKTVQPLVLSGKISPEGNGERFSGSLEAPNCTVFFVDPKDVFDRRIALEKSGASSATTSTGPQRVTLDLASIRKSAGLVPVFDILYGGDHLYAAFGTHGTVYVQGITRNYSGSVRLRQCRFNNVAGCLEVLVPGVKLQETGVGWGGKNAGEVSSPTSRYEFSYSGSRDSNNIYVNYTNRQDKVAAHQQARQDFLKNYSIKVLGSRQSGERAIKDAHMLASYAGSCRDMFRKISITPAKGARPGPMKIMVRWSLQRTYEPLHLEEKGDPVHIERTYTLNAQNKYSVTEEVKYECVETSLRVHTAAFSLLGRLMGMSKEKTGFDTALTGTKFGFDVIQVEAQ